MSSPAIALEDFDKIDTLVQNNQRAEAMNWIVAHEAIEQVILLEYIKRRWPA